MPQQQECWTKPQGFVVGNAVQGFLVKLFAQLLVAASQPNQCWFAFIVAAAATAPPLHVGFRAPIECSGILCPNGIVYSAAPRLCVRVRQGELPRLQANSYKNKWAGRKVDIVNLGNDDCLKVVEKGRTGTCRLLSQ